MVSDAVFKERKVSIKKVTSVEQLKKESSPDSADFFILLNGRLKSSKHIGYDEVSDSFWVLNFIDDSEQNIPAKHLMNKNITNIGKAIEQGAFYKEEY